MTEAFDPIGPLSTILTEHGPLGHDELAEQLRDAGVADPDRVLRRLLIGIDVPARRLSDERWIWLPSVLAGRMFTRRVTEPEVRFDLLTITPDLAPIAPLCDSPAYQRLSDGAALDVVTAGDKQLLCQLGIPIDALNAGDAIALPRGTFEELGVDEGDLVGLRLSDAGLVVERVATTTTTAVGAPLAALLDGQPEAVGALVWRACLADPALFTEPVAPLTEIAAKQGLVRHEEWLAPPDFDFRDWVFARECDQLARRHRLTGDAAATLNLLLRLYGLLAAYHLRKCPDPDVIGSAVNAVGDIMADVGDALADPVIAEALTAETVRHGPFSAAGLRALADALAPRVAPPARVACQWLRAVACEREGDIAGFERALLEAEAMDGTWPLPLIDLAGIASDRGDAEGGLALLRRARAKADHPLVYLLREYRPTQRTDLGRNAPCWCGSGRKYKRCHLGRLPLRDRARWLYHKAVAHVMLGDWTDLRHAAAFARCGSVVHDIAEFNAALADPVVIDIVLFEGGGFDEFLAVRGDLLPEDERKLAEQWRREPRSVFEVERVHPDGSAVVCDARTGERHEVAEDVAGYPLQAGQLICARVTSDGVDLRLLALEPVSAQQCGPLLALLDGCPDPVELVAQLSGGAVAAR